MRTPNDPQKKAIIKGKLDALIRYLMQVAEFQVT
jgi:hypothetical protein